MDRDVHSKSKPQTCMSNTDNTAPTVKQTTEIESSTKGYPGVIWKLDRLQPISKDPMKLNRAVTN